MDITPGTPIMFQYKNGPKWNRGIVWERPHTRNGREMCLIHVGESLSSFPNLFAVEVKSMIREEDFQRNMDL